MSIRDLAPEVLCSIVKFLDITSFSRLSRSCKGFHATLEQELYRAAVETGPDVFKWGESRLSDINQAKLAKDGHVRVSPHAEAVAKYLNAEALLSPARFSLRITKQGQALAKLITSYLADEVKRKVAFLFQTYNNDMLNVATHQIAELASALFPVLILAFTHFDPRFSPQVIEFLTTDNGGLPIDDGKDWNQVPLDEQLGNLLVSSFFASFLKVSKGSNDIWEKYLECWDLLGKFMVMTRTWTRHKPEEDPTGLVHGDILAGHLRNRIAHTHWQRRHGSDQFPSDQATGLFHRAATSAPQDFDSQFAAGLNYEVECARPLLAAQVSSWQLLGYEPRKRTLLMVASEFGLDEMICFPVSDLDSNALWDAQVSCRANDGRSALMMTTSPTMIKCSLERIKEDVATVEELDMELSWRGGSAIHSYIYMHLQGLYLEDLSKKYNRWPKSTNQRIFLPRFLPKQDTARLLGEPIMPATEDEVVAAINALLNEAPCQVLQSKAGIQPLHLAIIGHPGRRGYKIIQSLLNRGANIHTPFSCWVGPSTLELDCTLLPSSKNRQGQSEEQDPRFKPQLQTLWPIHAAMLLRDQKLVDILMASGANPNAGAPGQISKRVWQTGDTFDEKKRRVVLDLAS